MKKLLVYMAVSLLAQALLGSAASAGCDPLTGARTAPFPAGGLCHTSFSPTDTDNDNFGNACDADYNNDCRVNMRDFLMFRMAFNTVGTFPLFDHNEPPDALVSPQDFAIFLSWVGVSFDDLSH